MRRLTDAILNFWRDKVRGPTLQTYDAAREELGGNSWRKFTNTERWFLSATPPSLPAVGATTLDTGALILAKPSLLDRLQGKGAWVGGTVALIVILIAAFTLSGSGRPTVALAAAPAAIPAPAPAPVEKTPAKAPVAAHAALSPSVQALFGGKSSGAKPQKSKARPKKVKRRHR